MMQSPMRSHLFRGLILAAAVLLASPAARAEKTVLRLRFDGPVLEAPNPQMDLLALFGQGKARSLNGWVKMIRKAADDPKIAGIAMIIESPQMSLAQAEEIRRSLQYFRSKDKKVYCYLDYGSNLTYALATAADHITLAEYSELSIVGIRAELSYYKGLFEKAGLEADMLHCGAYKSALEPYTRTGPSEEAAANINWLLDGIFDAWTRMIADGRSQSQEEVKALVDAAPLTAQTALEKKLVDAVSSFPDFTLMIQKEFGKDVKILKKLGDEDKLKMDFENPFAIFQMFSEIMEKASAPKKSGIGVIYVEGGILVGKSQQDMFAGAVAGSTTVRAAFEEARKDDAIKAVVVRVDSPGGSAIASDIMWNAATLCAKEKPVIVSMGGVAGSGGYYVSLPGDTIFAEETTITGSIGVVGGKIVWNGLFEGKLGITTTAFNRGKHAGLMSAETKWNDEERELMEGYLNNVYTQFKGRVTESRGTKIKGDLESMAGGRVFTGRQALERGLVDRIGGLHDAISLAAEKVGLKTYETYVLPKQKGLAEILMEISGEESRDEWEIAALAPNQAQRDPVVAAAIPLLKELAPEKVRRFAESLRNLIILNRERVGCFMPFSMSVE